MGAALCNSLARTIAPPRSGAEAEAGAPSSLPRLLFHPGVGIGEEAPDLADLVGAVTAAGRHLQHVGPGGEPVQADTSGLKALDRLGKGAVVEDDEEMRAGGAGGGKRVEKDMLRSGIGRQILDQKHPGA